LDTYATRSLLANPGRGPLRTAALTTLALVAFAANSVLCRLALGEATIDAASFSTIRLTSGAAMLLLVSGASANGWPSMASGDWRSAALLFSYAAPFSFAYVTLSTGTGALILFGAVQAAMIVGAVRSGERPHRAEWAGLLIALFGLAYLVSPGVTAPTPLGSALMAIAGVSWGLYTLRGRGRAPVPSTTGNFVRSVPFVAGLSLVMWPSARISLYGALLAVVSGAMTSGLGYVVWYAALGGLSATRAAIVQLSVPVLAALGGVVFLSERVSLRLVLSAVLILGGVGLAVMSRSRLAGGPGPVK
jgi:drug/metabolite transporter (DMT)-like permease